jgi:hypothetical protein
VLVGWGREGGITCGKIVFDTGYPESFGGKLSPLHEADKELAGANLRRLWSLTLEGFMLRVSAGN